MCLGQNDKLFICFNESKDYFGRTICFEFKDSDFILHGCVFWTIYLNVSWIGWIVHVLGKDLELCHLTILIFVYLTNLGVSWT
jgi:hypothetical protein